MVVLRNAQMQLRSHRSCQDYTQDIPAHFSVLDDCTLVQLSMLPEALPRRLNTDPKMEIPDSSERTYSSLKPSEDEQEIQIH